ncbi:MULTISPECIES: hypothetical protein [unclassified Micromonospora]|uniref:hypothetical protein n=1 Tax=unclassified Micromonospora TaxID=2617518 RepID=UPI00104504E5|nr:MULTISPECIES: hypothetical protein [unclassified Micromonospora]TDB79517.1 hypothetical protein E1182_12295 [Micromonospora sp. KC721]TDC38848.1 hypothetical protein E1166_17750 [Micromonospora sp. KC213]TDC72876.1 hypothetical protein E1193_26755 [Micromonospora sp. KC606]
MASIQEIKAGINQFGRSTQDQIAQMRAVHDSINQSLAMLRAVTSGTTHPSVAEAIARMEQVKKNLNEASQLAGASIEATKRYSASF